MRVIAGIYGSRKLLGLRGLALRPSSDRLRQTLFNILGPAVEDSLFVDLFAGTGAVGIEALSRGARRAIFVEAHEAGMALVRRNLQSLGIAVVGIRGERGELGFSGGAELMTVPAAKALETLESRGTRADFIFADPPWADSVAYSSVLETLGDSELLAADGRLILEHDRRRSLPAIAGGLERARVVVQGDSALSFYRIVRAA